MEIRLISKSNILHLCMSAIFSKTLVKKSFGLTILNNFKNFDGFLMKNCKIIHSFFMRFEFDVIFVDKEMSVVAMYSDFKPFRISKFHKTAKYVLELPKGTIKKFDINLFDKIELEEKV